MVRCGSCHRIFNSLPRLVEALPEIQEKERKAQEGKVNAGDIPVVESEEIFEEIEITDPIPTPEAPKPQALPPPPPPTPAEAPPATKQATSGSIHAKQAVAVQTAPPNPALEPPNSITAALRKTNDPQKLEASRKALHDRLAKTKSKLLAKRQNQGGFEPSESEALFNSIIAGNELINASATDVAPADLRFDAFDDEYDVEKYSHPPPPAPTPAAAPTPKLASSTQRTSTDKARPGREGFRINTMFWAGGIMALMLLIIIQYAFFIKEDLVKYPSMRPLFQTVCGIVSCDPLMFDSKKLKIIANLDFHPDNPGALKINIKVINQAELTQYFPVLELVLRDGDKQHVELFYPVQYLPKRGLEKKGIPPKKHFEAQLNIVNPFHGKDTLSYQINALRDDT